MDWNTKWDWENLINSKTTKNFSKQRTTDWEFEEDIMGTGPFRVYEVKNSSSGSELAPGSSARSSLSVCTDSSFKKKNMQLAFQNTNTNKDESPPPLESSVGSGESLIGLKLGKRMYFENNGCAKTVSAPEVLVSSNAPIVKRIKSTDPITPRCQVEGCNLDLSAAKEYHRKHKVCASHSKCPKVVIGGLERRFCQQCSRFHNLSEFDEKKRSCRRRLTDHNARRRKPQLDPMMRLPSPFSAFTGIDGSPQMSFLSSNAPHVYSRASSDSIWASSLSSNLTTKNGCMLNFGENGDINKQLQMAGTQLARVSSPTDHSFNRIAPSKGTKSETLTQGLKESVLPPNLDSGPDYHRALSLLSNNSWTSFPPPNNSLDHSITLNRMHYPPLLQSFPQSFLQTSTDLYLTDHLSTNSFAAPANAATHFQPFKPPIESALYSNLFN